MNTLENKMLIGRGSILTGSTSEMEIDVTEKQITLWMEGELIQNVMPNLTPVEREFLISGMSKAEQEKIFNVQS
jgi:hypothetical protein|tara:strand:- start:1902 stop:2123 length:222 start_codon:yes stop_codon:yes gene_type:complete